MLLREFCAENMERVPAAIDAGAMRIELCDNLACGGTSPSWRWFARVGETSPIAPSSSR